MSEVNNQELNQELIEREKKIEIILLKKLGQIGFDVQSISLNSCDVLGNPAEEARVSISAKYLLVKISEHL